MPMELVRERKFVAHSRKVECALEIMRHFCISDHEYPVGFINSIYYDTSKLQSYTEKIEGDKLKRKVRLRWYNETETTEKNLIEAFLEFKYRTGSSRHKNRKTVNVSREWINTVPLNDHTLISLLADQVSKVDDLLPLALMPAICISYERHRFVCPRIGSRISIDINIHANRINPDLFVSTIPIALDIVVCECKDFGLLDLPWAHQLCRAGFRQLSFSKYGECINRALLGGAPQ